jgi:hypothetical protein
LALVIIWILNIRLKGGDHVTIENLSWYINCVEKEEVIKGDNKIKNFESELVNEQSELVNELELLKDEVSKSKKIEEELVRLQIHLKNQHQVMLDEILLLRTEVKKLKERNENSSITNSFNEKRFLENLLDLLAGLNTREVVQITFSNCSIENLSIENVNKNHFRPE